MVSCYANMQIKYRNPFHQDKRQPFLDCPVLGHLKLFSSFYLTTQLNKLYYKHHNGANMKPFTSITILNHDDETTETLTLEEFIKRFNNEQMSDAVFSVLSVTYPNTAK